MGKKHNYGLVKWYRKQTTKVFDDFVIRHKKRDKLKEKTRDNYFNDLIKETGKPELASNRKLTKKTKEEIEGLIENDANDYFNNLLFKIVEETELPKPKKTELEKISFDYDDEDEFRELVDRTIQQVEEEKQKKIEEKISGRKKIINELKKQSQKEFEQGNLETLISIRNEARKFKKDFPEEFSLIDSNVRGLRLQLRQEQREIQKQREEEKRIEREKLLSRDINPDF